MAFIGGGRIAGSAKARVRRGTLLSPDEMTALLEQQTVPEIAERLRGSSFGVLLNRLSAENVRRGELEFLLDVSVLAEGLAFRPYADAQDRKLLDLWLENFDIELIKNFIRSLVGGGQPEHMSSDRTLEIVSGFRLTLVDQDRLLSANSLREIIASIKKESLRFSLSAVLPPNYEDLSFEDVKNFGKTEFQEAIFSLMMTIDRFHLNALYEAAESVGGQEGRATRMLIGVRVDLTNLYWIYRARRFFGMSPEEALTLILKARYRADFDMLTKFAFAAPDAMASVLSDTIYSGIFEFSEDDDKNVALREMRLESRVSKMLLSVSERVLASGSHGFQNIAAYLTLKEFEIRDITAIMEAVRYGFDKNKTAMLLIRTLESLGKEMS
ncbi:hypothetical protein FACS1894204_01910 [Synergistales bacterium]|nr:hypothetical protein FACS1894204_01910 [Synergistales bacterium]